MRSAAQHKQATARAKGRKGSRSRTLGEHGGLTSLVLGDLVVGVLLALLAGAEGLTGLGDVDLDEGINPKIDKRR